MPNKMLIDATHPEETRVVVVRGNKVEDFDFESADRRPLRGNIYLAKVTRVEPSLQAAFIEYGGNRHGFLAFSEIHPDYYQIPVADREALLAAEARADEEEESRRGRQRRRGDPRRSEAAPAGADEADAEDGVDFASHRDDDGDTGREPSADEHPADHAGASYRAETGGEGGEPAGEHAGEGGLHADDDGFLPADVGESDARIEIGSDEAGDDEAGSDDRDDAASSAEEAAEQLIAAGYIEAGIALQSANEEDSSGGGEVVEIAGDEDDEEHGIEHVGGGDELEEMPVRSPRRHRQYKIQEVIRRRQIMLVQVVKEERGTKGAALTTYLSLAGRYSVLMPNTARGGGISRKINDAHDRKRLREIVDELEVPDGMGIILRTAGASRTKTEIKRDFEYLLRMWETIRDVTLKSTAPALVYEEGSLIKRSIRDLYNKDVDQILVAGEDAYREAKDFMRMLMPSHAKVVQPYREQRPIFSNDNVETQLDAMFNAHVTLKSGGYIVINQTEALVAIDVNSGRSTREHNIEDTALRTNVEAADEVARQLRLRDLAGLIVVDFIDMEESRNNRSVERRMKDALRNDRARIQVGRISHFGLLEMSRQRIRTGVLESSSVPCPHCGGSGSVRSVPSVALYVLRLIEDHLRKDASYHLNVRVSAEIALYVLNQKRWHVQEVERRYLVDVFFSADETIAPHQHAVIEKREPVSAEDRTARSLVRLDPVQPVDEIDDDGVPPEEDDEVAVEQHAASGESDEAAGKRKRRRRRRRGGPAGADAGDQPIADDASEHYEEIAGDDDPEAESDEEGRDGAEAASAEPPAAGDEPSRRRRRGRRGGRRARREPTPFGDPGAPATGEAAAYDWNEDPGEEPPERVPDVDGDGRPAEPLALEDHDPPVMYEPADEPEPAETLDEGTSWDPTVAGPAIPEVGEPDGPSRFDPETDDLPTHRTQAAEPAATPQTAVAPEPGEDAPSDTLPEPEPEPEPEPDTPGVRRSGWWQRRLLG